MKEIKGKLGFGCMHLPMTLAVVDKTEFNKMIDAFMEAGFNYFDTAHGYLAGMSEKAIKTCLVSRYDRESYFLTNKLSEGFFKKEEDIVPLFEKQLNACGVEYFDYYLMHALSAKSYQKYQDTHAFDVCMKLKEEGRIKHLGISFHDVPEVLDKILSDHPEIEVVQLQFNYADYNNPGVESRGCYEVCEKHGKPVIVMEPVKGGSLVNLPDAAKKVFDNLGGGSYASFAIRFAASFPNIMMVLSGMGSMEMMTDNVSYMKNFKPLDENEMEAIEKVRAILDNQNLIQCTGCRYCVDGCPKNIIIPEIFAIYNQKKQHAIDWNSSMYYKNLTANSGKAKDCIKCGKCEHICPQNLPIRDLLKKASRRLDIVKFI